MEPHGPSALLLGRGPRPSSHFKYYRFVPSRKEEPARVRRRLLSAMIAASSDATRFRGRAQLSPILSADACVSRSSEENSPKAPQQGQHGDALEPSNSGTGQYQRPADACSTIRKLSNRAVAPTFNFAAMAYSYKSAQNQSIMGTSLVQVSRIFQKILTPANLTFFINRAQIGMLRGSRSEPRGCLLRLDNPPSFPHGRIIVQRCRAKKLKRLARPERFERPDPQICSLMLYPAELRALVCVFGPRRGLSDPAS